MRILEKKYKDKYTYLKKKEQEIAKREKALAEGRVGGSGSCSNRDGTDEELEEMDRIEKKLQVEIERAERENQEIDQCIEQNTKVMDELRQEISRLQSEI